MNREIEALEGSLRALSGLDRQHLPAPAAPPRPCSDHPMAEFYRLPSYCSVGDELPEAASGGQYL
jgi:hypothetical protein